MSLSKLCPNLPISFFNRMGVKNKRTALFNIKKPEIQKVLLAMSPELDAFLNKVADQLHQVVQSNPALIEEPPKAKRVPSSPVYSTDDGDDSSDGYTESSSPIESFEKKDRHTEKARSSVSDASQSQIIRKLPVDRSIKTKLKRSSKA